MARIRTVKPGLFRHEDLYEAETISGLPLRLAYIGLFTCCDREGRFNWRPRALKLDVMPYDEVDFSRVLDALSARGFIVKYACAGEEYGFIPSFPKHQIINNRELASNLPTPCEINIIDTSSTREPRVKETLVGNMEYGREGNMEGKGKDNCAEPSRALALVDDPVVITFPTNRPDQVYSFLQSQFEKIAPLYPGVDVPQQLREMVAWLLSNPKNAKTHSGIPRFINSWLSKSQNRSNSNGHGQRQSNHERAHDVARELAADIASGQWSPGTAREISGSRSATITLLPTGPKP